MLKLEVLLQTLKLSQDAGSIVGSYKVHVIKFNSFLPSIVQSAEGKCVVLVHSFPHILLLLVILVGMVR